MRKRRFWLVALPLAILAGLVSAGCRGTEDATVDKDVVHAKDGSALPKGLAQNDSAAGGSRRPAEATTETKP